jgi:murein DD-endopeptidase MepM/ murein hydrolase activator NlpD
MKNRKYDIIVLSDEHANQRQFSLSKRAITMAVGSVILGILGLMAMGYYMLRDFSAESQVAELQRQNDELKMANERYLEASVEMERKLNQFDEKTSKLALLVGVEPGDFQADGIGGPDVLDQELSRYLRYDLGLLEQKTELLEQRLSDLDGAFKTKTDLLDSTPSILPAHGWLSSGFKYRTDPFTKKKTWHNGLDISCVRGTPIYAPAKGVVSYKGYQGGFGNLLEISHGDGLKTKFAHLDKFNVSKGQRVKRGDLIGYVGSTGRSTAPHLHYEIHKNGKALNPMKYIIREVKSL